MYVTREADWTHIEMRLLGFDFFQRRHFEFIYTWMVMVDLVGRLVKLEAGFIATRNETGFKSSAGKTRSYFYFWKWYTDKFCFIMLKLL